MLSFFMSVLKSLDFVKLSEFQRGRNKRKVSARLHLILVTAYDIIEVFEELIKLLEKSLKEYRRDGNRYIMSINPSWTESLLRRQADNLGKLDRLVRDLYAEVRVLDPAFEKTYRDLVPSKFGIFFEAQQLLWQGRLGTHEDHPVPYSRTAGLTYRTLWLSEIPKDHDRQQDIKYLHADDGMERSVIDVNMKDGEPFFRELARYLEEERPHQRLIALRETAETYKQALMENLSLEDVLLELGRLNRAD
ncbi:MULTISPECIES: hypothetical protein [unclassified Sphingomonas]|uniref:hypothetical protein n=1 Tax=unclassified Sphingomonas TaxID=196159 RepID=UPI000FF45DBE|nr:MULTISPECIES: hypothetical protein [unclassified Sphingomonas]RKE42418.1 hypothetical protein C8J39_3674 [Sphingomonas sp. PP-CC-1A-547]TCM03770.1 hypothetical protein C8J41_11029 [Sphingomonas sp. PP-CC-3G-468]